MISSTGRLCTQSLQKDVCLDMRLCICAALPVMTIASLVPPHWIKDIRWSGTAHVQEMTTSVTTITLGTMMERANWSRA